MKGARVLAAIGGHGRNGPCALVATIVVVLALLIAIIAIPLVVIRRRKRKQTQAQEMTASVPAASVPAPAPAAPAAPVGVYESPSIQAQAKEFARYAPSSQQVKTFLKSDTVKKGVSKVSGLFGKFLK
jgi:heme/copper-type cytochrome/quinol oxidase subunit 2